MNGDRNRLDPVTVTVPVVWVKGVAVFLGLLMALGTSVWWWPAVVSDAIPGETLFAKDGPVRWLTIVTLRGAWYPCRGWTVGCLAPLAIVHIGYSVMLAAVGSVSYVFVSKAIAGRR